MAVRWSALPKWTRVRPSGWLCGDGRYTARFNFTVCIVYLLYASKRDYETAGANYQTFNSLSAAKEQTP